MYIIPTNLSIIGKTMTFFGRTGTMRNTALKPHIFIKSSQKIGNITKLRHKNNFQNRLLNNQTKCRTKTKTNWKPIAALWR